MRISPPHALDPSVAPQPHTSPRACDPRARSTELSGQKFKHLYEAIRLHSDGHTEAEPALRACWDADWLDLSRVGITPEPRHLCTVHGRQGERLRVAVRMGRGVHSGSRAYRDVAGADTWKPRGGLSGPTPAGPRATGLRAACR
jgi:hypothetical protein